MNRRARPPADDPATVLRARALALAQREAPAASGSSMELLEFRLAGDRYAIETRHVAGVLPLLDLTPVPCTPAFIAGVLNVRGRITTVIDMQKFFGHPARGITDLHHVILLRGGEFEVGVLADAVVGVRGHPREALQAALPGSGGVPAEYVLGITAERVLVLDLALMLTDRRLIVNEEVNP